MKRLLGHCIELNGAKIQAMNESETDLSAQNFRRTIGANSWKELETLLNYRDESGYYNPKLKLSTDPMVGFYKSHYDGKPCVFCRHSAIEYVYQ